MKNNNTRYEVHQRDYNSGSKISTIFVSDSLKGCEDFADTWNYTMETLYDRYSSDLSMYYNFASVYDTLANNYIDD